MKSIFDNVSAKCSKLTTNAYSTSFSLGIYLLDKEMHKPIYGIYGFVRFADEIVDSFHGYDKEKLLEQFQDETYRAIQQKISLNPILNSFQEVVNKYKIEHALIQAFLESMAMDLEQKKHTKKSYERYILGSAEVVGLMCLHVFTNGNKAMYKELKPSAMKLGAAFQKVNFLRDLRADYKELGRNYFPDMGIHEFNMENKRKIEAEIEEDFKEALEGIKKLPTGAKRGVYTAYVYYQNLFQKIRKLPAERIMKERIRIPNGIKLGLMFNSLLRYQMNAL